MADKTLPTVKDGGVFQQMQQVQFSKHLCNEVRMVIIDLTHVKNF